jgi:tRNA_anti-like
VHKGNEQLNLSEKIPMKRLKTILLILSLFAAIAAAYAWFFVWNKPQTNVEKSKGIPVSATVLFQAYTVDEQLANKTYLEEIVEVTGEVKTISINGEGFTVVVLKTDDPMFGINCTVEEKKSTMKEGETVTLKGICTGYLTDVVLIRCHRIK